MSSWRATVKIGEFLLGLGLFIYLITSISWGAYPAEDRALAVIACGIGLILLFPIVRWSKDVRVREAVDVMNTVLVTVAISILLGSLIAEGIEGLAILSGKHEAYEFETYSVDLEGLDKVSMDIEMINGDVVLEPYNGDSIFINATIKVRGMTELEAVKHLDDINLKVEHSRNQELVVSIDLKYKVKFWYRTDLHIKVPTTPEYSVNIEDINGNLIFGNSNKSTLNGLILSLTTVNGNIDIQKSKFKEVSLETVNGYITSQIDAEDFTCETTNGHITIIIIGSRGRYSLSSVNGGIEIYMLSNATFKVDLSTVSGSIDILTSNVIYERSERKEKVAYTPGYSLTTGIYLEASTVNGGIKVSLRP